MRRPVIMWLRDPRFSIFMLVWAVAATIILLRYHTFRSTTSVSHSVSEIRNSKDFLAKHCPYNEWHGGSPSDVFVGSCWCGKDKYCMCTPSLAIDAIIEVWNDEEFDKIQPPASSKDSVVSQSHHPSYAVLPSSTVSVLNNSKRNVSIILVRRKDPPRDKFAITGGFVDVGETVEAATVREVKEETNLQVVHLEQFHVYSDPTRDARRHTVSSVFRCLIKYSDVLKSLKKGSDAKAVVVFPLNREILDLNLAFDHRTILRDYIIKYHPHLLA